MKNIKIISLLSIFAMAILLQGCDDDPVNGTVRINFGYSVGSESLTLNSKEYTSPVGYEYEIQNNKYYLSRINLNKEDGGIVELALVHLRDIHDESSKTLEVSDIPAGTYKSLSFTFGLNEADNDQSVLPNTVENQNMYWPKMLTGNGLPPAYHFMKYEGKYTLINTSEVKNFNLHLGPTHGNNNFFNIEIAFDKEFKIDGNTKTIDLVCDLQEWLSGPNVFDYEKYGQSIMPKQPAQEELKANGSSVFRISKVN